MADAQGLNAGFNVYRINAVGEVWDGGTGLHRFVERLGNVVAEAPSVVEFRTIDLAHEDGVANRLSSFKVGEPGHVGLLAMPRGLGEGLHREYPGIDARPAVVSRTAGGRMLAGPLPKEAYPGTARLVLEAYGGMTLRVLALPGSSAAEPPHPEDEHPILEIDTALYRFFRRGRASAALGWLLGEHLGSSGNGSLALPTASLNGPPVDSIPLTDEVLRWAQASRTPIL